MKLFIFSTLLLCSSAYAGLKDFWISTAAQQQKIEILKQDLINKFGDVHFLCSVNPEIKQFPIHMKDLMNKSSKERSLSELLGQAKGILTISNEQYGTREKVQVKNSDQSIEIAIKGHGVGKGHFYISMNQDKITSFDYFESDIFKWFGEEHEVGLSGAAPVALPTGGEAKYIKNISCSPVAE
ncbi:MAG: hypothetical protein AB7I27_11715 [Bacteriovoracaceae bacterium]